MEIANENDIIIAHANQILITAQLFFFFTIYTIIDYRTTKRIYRACYYVYCENVLV